MTNDWYLLREGTTAGPYSATELRKLVVNGHIAPDDWVRRDDQGPWGLASRVKGLFGDTARDTPTTYSQSTVTAAIRVPSGAVTLAVSEVQTMAIAPLAVPANVAESPALRFLGLFGRMPYVLLVGLLAAAFCTVLVFHGMNTGGGGLVGEEGVDGKEEETANGNVSMPESAAEKGDANSRSAGASPTGQPPEIPVKTSKEAIEGAKRQQLPKRSGSEAVLNVADAASKKAQAEPPRQDLASRKSSQIVSIKEPVHPPELAKEIVPKPRDPLPPDTESEELEQRLARLTELYGQQKKMLADRKTGAKRLAELDGEQKQLQANLIQRDIGIQNIRSQIDAINAEKSARVAQFYQAMRNQAVSPQSIQPPVTPQLDQRLQVLMAQGLVIEAPIPTLRNSLDQVEAKLAVIKKLMQELEKDLERSIPEILWLCDPFGRFPRQSHLQCRRLCSLWIAVDQSHWLPFLARGFAYADVGEHELAIQDLDKAGQLEPRLAAFVAGGRALVFARSKSPRATTEFAKAKKAFKLKLAIGDLFLGHVAAAQGHDTAAEQSFRRAVVMDKSCPQAYESLAFFLATRRAIDGGSRRRAIQDAMTACKLTEYREWVYLDTLAIACAANEDFKLAAGWARKSIDCAPPQFRTLLKERLKSYEQNKPCKPE
ncbi:MAG: GYF domain-containing protein [Planctomycetota bacterium]